MGKNSFAALAMAGLSVPAAAWAQPAPSTQHDQAAHQLDEIVVVAEKRAENLQQIAITATAVTGGELQARGAVNTKDLQTIVAGLVFTQTLPAGNPYLRGVGQNAGAIGLESPVAFYVDGVYFAQAGANVLDLNSIDQITVLKGPQGTLFGRNASGGVIQVATRSPSEQFTADADVGYANYETYSAHAYVSGPLAAGLSASVAAFGNNRVDGYGRNLFLNKEIYTQSTYGGQVRVDWTPTENSKVDLNLLHTFRTGYTGTSFGVPEGSLGEDGVSRYVGEYNSLAGTDPRNTVKQSMAALTVTHDAPAARFQAILSAHDYYEKFAFAQNALPLGHGVASIVVWNNPARTYTAEAQVQAPIDQAFQWVVGGFFMDDDVKVKVARARDLAVFQHLNSEQVTRSYALFAQGTLPLGESTRVTAGARYTIDRKRLSGNQFSGTGVLQTTVAASAAAVGFPPHKTWKEATYRLAIDHDLTEDAMVFASYNRGFKSGIYNPSAFTNPPTLPETIDAFEVGSKNMFLDRRVRLNVSVFRYYYDNLQLRTVVPPSQAFVLYNAAKSKVTGVDVDGAFRVAPNFTLTGAAEWLHGRYQDFPAGVCAVPRPGGGNVSVACNLSDTPMMRSPRWTANLGGNYTVPVQDDGEVTLNLSWAYNSGFSWEASGRTRQKAYHSVAGSVRWSPEPDRWSIMLWGSNLLDENIRSTGGEASTDVYSPGAPRTYGVTVAAHF